MEEEITRILSSLVLTTLLAVLGFIIASYLNENFIFTKECIVYVRASSMSLFAWAVFARLYNFQSWKGKTPAEKLKRAWFIITYSIGFFGSIMSLFMVANV